MTTILVTGKNGQLGWELQRALSSMGSVVALDRRQMDLMSPDSIRTAFRDIKPGVIVNAAAYTAVDRAESEPELAMAINGIAPGVLAAEAKRIGAALIHYSTDYVFDGARSAPYTEEDPPNPLGAYGKSKLAGETAIAATDVPHLILRTGWLYSARRGSFVLTILRLATKQTELRIVADQTGAPTWAASVADTTAQIVQRHGNSIGDFTGIYHLTAGGETSWYEFAQTIIRELHDRDSVRSPVHVVPISLTEYGAPAPRPRYCVLSNAKMKSVFGIELADWRMDFARFAAAWLASAATSR